MKSQTKTLILAVTIIALAGSVTLAADTKITVTFQCLIIHNTVVNPAEDGVYGGYLRQRLSPIREARRIPVRASGNKNGEQTGKKACS